MKIYLAYNFTGSDKQILQKLIEDISTKLEKLGHENFCYFRNVQEWDQENINRSEIMPTALNNLNICNALLMVVASDDKSVGMGIEVGYAKAKGNKIYLAKKQGIETDYFESLADKTIIFGTNQPSIEDLKELLSI